MKILLSIKPEFAEKIFDGTKKFEYRKTIFKKPEIDTVILYVSYPVQRVIGEFSIDIVIEEKIDKLWDLTKKYSGINQTYFKEYFKSKDTGYAIKVKKVIKYDKPLSIKDDFNISYPPQSFMYIK